MSNICVYTLCITCWGWKEWVTMVNQTKRQDRGFGNALRWQRASQRLVTGLAVWPDRCN